MLFGGSAPSAKSPSGVKPSGARYSGNGLALSKPWSPYSPDLNALCNGYIPCTRYQRPSFKPQWKKDKTQHKPESRNMTLQPQASEQTTACMNKIILYKYSNCWSLPYVNIYSHMNIYVYPYLCLNLYLICLMCIHTHIPETQICMYKYIYIYTCIYRYRYRYQRPTAKVNVLDCRPAAPPPQRAPAAKSPLHMGIAGLASENAVGK